LEKNESYSENTQENKNGERITLGWQRETVVHAFH
jgi:hypothetical protein